MTYYLPRDGRIYVEVDGIETEIPRPNDALCAELGILPETMPEWGCKSSDLGRYLLSAMLLTDQLGDVSITDIKHIASYNLPSWNSLKYNHIDWFQGKVLASDIGFWVKLNADWRVRTFKEAA